MACYFLIEKDSSSDSMIVDQQDVVKKKKDIYKQTRLKTI